MTPTTERPTTPDTTSGDDYTRFIASKFAAAPAAGFDYPASRLPAAMKPHQRAAALWAIRLGRSALFLGTGLGKSLIELAWCRAVAEHTNRPTLLLTPLAVGPQMANEADKFGVPGVRLAASQDDVPDGPGVYVTNYHKLDKFDPAAFAGVALDESSILKSFTGTIKRQLCDSFRETPYRLAGTATPAPNDYMELGNHSAFLGVMDSDEMLTRWFINDLSEAGVYRLKKHAESDYWRWVASWACCVSRPSDLGFDDAGYDLPPLETIEHVVAADLSSPDALFRSDRLSATTMHREKRKTAADRAAKVAEIVAAEPNEPWLIWCDTDYEADALLAAVTGSVDVRGSQTDRVKLDRLTGFTDGRHRVLIGKPVQCGFGLNWQHCARVAFVGVSYSWEQFYQAIRRCWRFGQTRPVHCHVVCAETETEVLTELKRKAADNDRMRAAMVAAVREHWDDGAAGRRSLRTDVGTERIRLPWWLYTRNNMEGVAC